MKFYILFPFSMYIWLNFLAYKKFAWKFDATESNSGKKKSFGIETEEKHAPLLVTFQGCDRLTH